MIRHILPHGGNIILEPETPISAADLPRLERCIPFWPEANRAAVEEIKTSLESDPGEKHLLLCQTAFFSHLPSFAAACALPYEYFEKGVRRYGSSGLAHARAWEQAHAGNPGQHTILSIVLDDTPSLAVIRDGAPLDCSAGFTPCEGILSRHFPGDLDASIPLTLVEDGMTIEEIQDVLLHQSGWSALAGEDLPLEELLSRQSPAAKIAVNVLHRSLLKTIGAGMSAAGGTEALVFSAATPSAVEGLVSDLCAGLAFAGAAPRPGSRDGISVLLVEWKEK